MPTLHDAIGGATFSLPAATTTVLSTNPVTPLANPTVPWFQLPADASILLTGLAAVPTSNTTIKVRLVAETQPDPDVYTSILSMKPPSGYVSSSMFSIGQKGSSWAYGRLQDGPTAFKAYWMTPWEPVDSFSIQTDIYEDIYYTFTPDGRVRIDMFTPYRSASGTTGYDWQESIQDGGWPLNTLAQNISTSTNPGIFLPSGTLILGKENGYSTAPTPYGFGDLTTEPMGSEARIAGISVYSAALPVNTMIADANTDFPSSALSLTGGQISPCNTGLWMGLAQKSSGTVKTPCGSNAKFASPVPPRPTLVTPLDNFVSHAPQNVHVTGVANNSVTVAWSAPATVGVAPTGYDIWVVGALISQLQVSGATHSATLAGLVASGNDQIYVAAVYAGSPYADVTAAPVSVETIPIGGPVNLHTTSLGANYFGLMWTVTDTYPGVYYTVLVNGVPKCVTSSNTCKVIGVSVHSTLSVAVQEQVIGSSVSVTSQTISVVTGVASGIFADGVPFGQTSSLDNSNALSLNAAQAAIVATPLQAVLDPPTAWTAFQASNGAYAFFQPNHYSAMTLLALAVGGSKPNQTFTVNYADGSTQNYTQSISDWGAPQGYANENVAVKMAYSNKLNGTKDTTKPYYLYQYTFLTDASKVVQSITMPNSSQIWVLDVVPYNNSVQVNLSNSYNAVGISNDGTSFAGTGINGLGYAYSAGLLGNYALADGSWILYGAPNTNNVVRAQGQIIPLPQGKYSTLNVIGTGVNGGQNSQDFIVDYTDGTSDTIQQSFSDWNTSGSGNNFNEKRELSMSWVNLSIGGTFTGGWRVYRYTFPVNNNKVLQDIRLPNNPNVAILGMNATQYRTLNDLSSPGLAPNYMPNFTGIYNDGSTFSTGLDGSGFAYSVQQLVAPPTGLTFGSNFDWPRWWNGIPFNFYPQNSNNVYSGNRIQLALNYTEYNNTFSWIYILGTGVGGITQSNQTFKVYYDDDSVDTFNLNLSDWDPAAPTYVPGQNLTTPMAYRIVGSNGSQQAGPISIYVYAIPISKNKFPNYLALPKNRNVTIESVTLVQ